MRIRLLAEGSKRWERFIRHWGIAFLVGEDVLFDTFGDAMVFSRNMWAMKIDRAKIRHVVISHDHWDHLAGLWPFLAKNKNVKVYICPGFSQETKTRIAAFGVPVVETAGPMEIRSGVYTTGQIRGVYDGRDIFEQAIVIKTERGLAVVTGCAHPGIAAIVNKVRECFAGEVFFVAGGFHLKDALRETIGNIIGMLKTIGVRQVAPLHCTGAVAQDIFRQAFGKNYLSLKVGGVVDLERVQNFPSGPGPDCDCPVCVFSKSQAPGDPYDLKGCPKYQSLIMEEKKRRRKE